MIDSPTSSTAAIVRSAALAGWKTVALSWTMLILNWACYWLVMEKRPTWFAALWGPGVDWAIIQEIWLRAMIYLKIGAWLQVLLVIWVSFWARGLRLLARDQG